MSETITSLPADLPGFTNITRDGRPALITTRFAGRTADGSRVHLTVELREVGRPAETVTHESAPRIVELSISGHVTAKHCREPYAVGQVADDLRHVTAPAAGLTAEDIAKLADIWDAWHLNGMRAGCAHMPAYVYPQSHEPDSAERWANRPTCPETGYRWGSLWLADPLPADVVTSLSDIVARAPRHH